MNPRASIPPRRSLPHWLLAMSKSAALPFPRQASELRPDIAATQSIRRAQHNPNSVVVSRSAYRKLPGFCSVSS